jgi:tetratricopeptide (TPR) repeat protein
MQKDWGRATRHLQKALDLERNQRTLSPTEWRVLVDNLGMAYGISGDLPKSKSTLEYGVKEDPKYPMFHYNLACYYGESNDLEHAMEELKTTFLNRSNGIHGEGIPDPRKDNSFRRFLNDPKFQALSKDLCPRSSSSEGRYVCSE